MLVIVHQEDAGLPVNGAVRSHDEIVRRMVGVSGAESLKNDGFLIGFVVTVGVFQKDEVGAFCDKDTTVPKLKSEWVVHLGELDDSVSLPVPVIVGKDEQRVVEFLTGLPFGVCLPSGGPQASFAIDLKLDRVHQLRELFFVGEKFDFESRGDGDVFDGLFSVRVFEDAFLHCGGAFASAADVGSDGNGLWHIGVGDDDVLAFCPRPDALIAIGRHRVED